MDTTTIKNHIAQLLQDSGLDSFGYCSAKPFNHLEDIYLERIDKGYSCEFEKRASLQALITPSQLLQNAQSFLVVLLPYSPYTEPVPDGHGAMSSGTASEDYHLVLNKILSPVKDLLKAYDIDSEIIVDTTPLSDRSIASRAGLGITRRNSMFYHKTYGSYVYIGSLLMTADLSEGDHQAMQDPCGQCHRCQSLCPSQAILGDGTIDSHRCISYLTQKKTLSTADYKLMGNHIYGCDICQQVCPANKGVKPIDIKTLVPKRPSLQSILLMTKSDFLTTYKRTDAGWRGKRTLQRNAIVAMGNGKLGQDHQFLRSYQPESPLLNQLVQDTLEMIDHRED